MAIVGKAFRKCLPEDKNSCVNCDNYLTCPLAVDGSKGSWVCDKTRIAVKRRGINSRTIQCSLAGHFQDLASGNFYELLQNFSTPGVRFGYIPVNNSGTLQYSCAFITASQPYCYSAGNHICRILTGSSSLYYI